MALGVIVRPHEDLCKVNIAKSIVFIVFFKRARNIETPPGIRQVFDTDNTLDPETPPGRHIIKDVSIVLLTGQHVLLSCYLQVHMTFSRTLTRPGPLARRVDRNIGKNQTMALRVAAWRNARSD